MAQLGSSVITGSLSVTNAIYGNLVGNADTATNSTCFGGCTYAQACTNIRNGLTTCVGTVTSVNVSVNGCSGTAIISSGTVTITNVPAYVGNYTNSTTSAQNLLMSANTTAGNKTIYTSSTCKLTFVPSTGVLTASCFDGIATNSTCFNGCTYSCAKADIRSGLTDCVGTVTSVNVSVNGKSGTAVTSSGTITITGVCACIGALTTSTTSAYNLMMSANNTAGCKVPYTSACCTLQFNPSTGCFQVKKNGTNYDIWDTAKLWIANGSSGATATCWQFGNCNGYIKFGNGLLVQWGYTHPNTTSEYTVVFPYGSYVEGKCYGIALADTYCKADSDTGGVACSPYIPKRYAGCFTLSLPSACRAVTWIAMGQGA